VFDAHARYSYTVTIATLPEHEASYGTAAPLIRAALARAMDIPESNLINIEVVASLPSGYKSAAVMQVQEAEHVRKQN
jgi:hypothetical protein